MADNGEQITYTIVIPRVRESIAVLLSIDTHQFFPAYLYLRRLASLRGIPTGITPNWSDLGLLFETQGGPAGKPNLRPFWKGQRESHQEWMNGNLAGSYSPSSLRGGPMKVVETDADGKYNLRVKHWQLASQHLLFGSKIPALALAGFFFRDFGVIAQRKPDTDDLVGVFRGYFGYGQGDEDEFDTLFDPRWVGSQGDWFEPFGDQAEV